MPCALHEWDRRGQWYRVARVVVQQQRWWETCYGCMQSIVYKCMDVLSWKIVYQCQLRTPHTHHRRDSYGFIGWVTCDVFSVTQVPNLRPNRQPATAPPYPSCSAPPRNRVTAHTTTARTNQHLAVVSCDGRDVVNDPRFVGLRVLCPLCC